MEWLKEVYDLVSLKNDDDAIYMVFDKIDNLCHETHNKSRKPIDDILAAIDINRLSITVCLSFLTAASWAGRSNLKNWNNYLKRVREKLEKEVPERADRLLDKFEESKP